MKNPFRYRGYYYDNETKLYYLNSRYYDPELGRFINIDDINVLNQSKDLVNGLNLYAYCSNNPIMLKDETGEAWWEWLIGALIIVAGVVLTAVTAGAAGIGLGAAFASVFTGASTGVAGFVASATIGAAIGAVVGGFSSGITSVLNGGDFWSGFSNGFMWGAISGAISGIVGRFSFGGLGVFGTKESFNKIQILLQGFIGIGVYGAKTGANNEKYTLTGSVFAFLGGIAGGFGAGMKIPSQIFLNIAVEIENILISLFKRVAGIKESLII